MRTPRACAPTSVSVIGMVSRPWGWAGHPVNVTGGTPQPWNHVPMTVWAAWVGCTVVVAVTGHPMDGGRHCVVTGNVMPCCWAPQPTWVGCTVGVTVKGGGQ